MSAPNHNPYGAPTASLHDSGYDNYVSEIMLASRSSRFAASIIDGIPIFIILLILAIPAFYDYRALANGESPDPSSPLWIIITGLFTLVLISINLYLLHQNGQTIGKKIMKIKIVRSDLYTPVSLGRIIALRYIPMSVVGMIPFIGYLIQLANYLFIFGAQQRCLHDLIADTHVIQAIPATAHAPAYSAQPPSSNW